MHVFASRGRVIFAFLHPKAWFSLDASVSISTSRNTKEKRHVMTFKDKAKWFSFEISFVFGSVLRLC